MMTWFKCLWQEIFVQTFQKVESEKQQVLTTSFNQQVVGILTLGTLMLVFVEYWGRFQNMITFLRGLGFYNTALQVNYWLLQQENQSFFPQIFWVNVTIFCFLFIPIVYVKFILKQPLSAFAWQFKASRNDILLYASCFLIMFPLVILASFTPIFQSKYPFYKPLATEPWLTYFLIWESLYLIQFIAVEFFFRGFLLHGIKKQFGFYSIWIVMIPYCMIHFHKPMPEAIGAIIAGLVLGTFSLKNNSIWLGVFLHAGVALTMDLMALWYRVSTF